jgi:hypothetical protein
VRLVADATGEAITEDQARFTNRYAGRYLVRPLQKIVMNITQHVPLSHQPENYLCEPGWVQNYNIRINDLPIYEDHPDSLWGLANRVGAEGITHGNIVIEQSLYLVKVEDLHLYKTIDGKRRVTFLYNQSEYDFPSTCTDFDKIESGESEHNNYIVVSLGEYFDGFHYKIVATIL